MQIVQKQQRRTDHFFSDLDHHHNSLDGLTCTINPRGDHGQAGELVVPQPCKQFLFNDMILGWLVVYLILGAWLTFLQSASV